MVRAQPVLEGQAVLRAAAGRDAAAAAAVNALEGGPVVVALGDLAVDEAVARDVPVQVGPAAEGAAVRRSEVGQEVLREMPGPLQHRRARRRRLLPLPLLRRPPPLRRRSRAGRRARRRRGGTGGGGELRGRQRSRPRLPQAARRQAAQAARGLAARDAFGRRRPRRRRRGRRGAGEHGADRPPEGRHLQPPAVQARGGAGGDGVEFGVPPEQRPRAQLFQRRHPGRWAPPGLLAASRRARVSPRRRGGSRHVRRQPAPADPHLPQLFQPPDRGRQVPYAGVAGDVQVRQLLQRPDLVRQALQLVPRHGEQLQAGEPADAGRQGRQRVVRHPELRQPVQVADVGREARKVIAADVQARQAHQVGERRREQRQGVTAPTFREIRGAGYVSVAGPHRPPAARSVISQTPPLRPLPSFSVCLSLSLRPSPSTAL
ncbi:MAG: hypothetical protein BJ554DRAFT_3976 [Olpidium bornovanus]|uniref:Uncharacterized protein n=1 Tax=Olpidium bornovanus TaxID=278681 RepID=A0A8H7ZNT9_9FUNG|nr:MAG: hypothetical protein BJ554DRAFT_3976 [Olpidium bornovanus]